MGKGKFLSVIALAAAAVMAAPASATTFIYDVDPGSDSIIFGKTNGWFKGFTDHFLFDTVEAGYVSAFVGSIALPSLDIILKNVLFDDQPITKLSTGNLELWSLNDTFVGAGRHTIKVSGYYGAKGGSYSGVFNFNTAVPEPASWAMMIAGFGMAGAAMRRRRTKLAVSYS